MKFADVRCVHCLEWFERDEITSDHVFPRAWYPDTTLANIEKWQIPACRGCNSHHGKIEERLLVRLGLCVDPAELKSLGVSGKALRAIDPSFATNDRDRRHRQAQRQKIWRSLRPAEKRLEILSGFELRPGIADQMATSVAKRDLEVLAQKITRGIMHVTMGSYIEPDHCVNVYFLSSDAAQPILDLIRKHGTVHDRGPGISITRALVPEDPRSGLFYIEIWGRLHMYSVVKPIASKRRSGGQP